MRDLRQGGKDGLNAHDSLEDGALSQFGKKDLQEGALVPLYDMTQDGALDGRNFILKEEDAGTNVQLVHVGSDSTVHFVNGGREPGLMGQTLAYKDHGDKDDSAESEDPATERNALMAQLKVLEAMLRHLQGEEQQRSLSEDPVVNASPIDIGSSYLHVGDSINVKRQRRPNPKYFDMDIEAEFLASGTALPSVASFRTSGEKSAAEPAGSSDGRSLQYSGSRDGYTSTRSNAAAAPLGFFDCCAARPAGTHRARTALAQKPRVFPSAKVPANSPGLVNNDTHLDNLSIRELHDAYRSTFGRETSVKDKLWLKRQISMGSGKPNGSSMGKENSRRNAHLAENNVKARLEKSSSAEEPLSDFGTTGINGGIMGGIGPAGSSPSADVRTDAKRPFRKTLSLAVLSPSDPSSLSPTVEGGREIRGATSTTENVVEVRDKGLLPVGGKRLRKPNRRYIEDQGSRGLGIGNGYPNMLSTYLSASNALRSKPLRLSWRSDADVVGDAYRNGTLRSTGHGIRPPTRSNICHGRRSKNFVVGTKRKSEGQAAPKLVKMIAHSARAARHDAADGAVRKVKFRLPAAPGQDKGEVLHGGDGEQVSCLLPVLTNGDSEDHQILSSHYLGSRLDDAREEPVITVPTANGGTRRKHHRPWTLREVVTLVDGVARCGGGKWADIKKLAFSTVGYRTAVDLKDKWRNLLRASRAQLHPPKEGETRKKHFSASIPSHILARVRELAALNNQMVAATNAGSSTTSRSGRPVNRR